MKLQVTWNLTNLTANSFIQLIKRGIKTASHLYIKKVAIKCRIIKYENI